MAQQSILEFQAKALFFRHWNTFFKKKEYQFEFRSILVNGAQQFDERIQSNGWIFDSRLVVKPDMLFGQRGKNGLVFVSRSKGMRAIKEVKDWITQKSSEKITLIGGVTGMLSRFLIEPFIDHKPEEEFYISARTTQYADVLSLSQFGGVNINENWEKVTEIEIPLDLSDKSISRLIADQLPSSLKKTPSFATFSARFYQFFKALHFTTLELNPFILRGSEVFILDTVAKLDDTAKFLMSDTWGNIDAVSPFGTHEMTLQAESIKQLDEHSGASLKLTVLNPDARVWGLVAGGGASVVYADTIIEAWGVEDLAIYGEYSGNPSESEVYHYTKTLIELMCSKKDKQGKPKILLVGGAIANFTDVAITFNGIIQAFQELGERMRDIGVRIYVRRGGPNYETGLKNIRNAAKGLGLPIEVYGPETHLTEIVRIALEDDAFSNEESINKEVHTSVSVV